MHTPTNPAEWATYNRAIKDAIYHYTDAQLAQLVCIYQRGYNQDRNPNTFTLLQSLYTEQHRRAHV